MSEASETPAAPAAAKPVLTRALTGILALACGLLVANLYYAQPVIGLIGGDLGIGRSSQGLVVTLTQLGYAAGLLLIVCLADLVENRRVILITMVGTIVGLVGIVFAQDAALFLIASFVVGFCSVGAQIVVPLATHLAPDEKRGAVIGNIMGGLLTGIMLARPFSSLITALWGWRAVFAVSAVLCAGLFVVLWIRLPKRQPEARIGYGAVVASTFRFLATERMLQRRAIYQALAFGLFNVFWTTAPLMLGHTFGFSQFGIALFALAGAGGALAAPFAGRLADRGHARVATAGVFALAAICFAATGGLVAASALIPLVIAAVLIDAATQANQVVGQRIIYGLAPDARGRINAAYMFTIFLGGALGSAFAPAIYERGGWTLTAIVGCAGSLVVLALFATERFDRRARAELARA